MKTLIVPCSGRSSRFKNTRPKFLLTMPDGELMVKKAISGLDLDSFDRIIITIVKPHCMEYEADTILNQVFLNDRKVETCILPDFTSSQSETVFETIQMMDVSGQIVIKDSDNYVSMDTIPNGNFVTGLNLSRYGKEVSRLGSKSFLIVNEQNVIVDIIEKKISSDWICVGVYGFNSASEFSNAYLEIKKGFVDGEVYISHVISFMIGTGKSVFIEKDAIMFEDWGTPEDLNIVKQARRTYFVDLDGVIFRNRGKYGLKNWSNDNEPLDDNIVVIRELYENGAQIVITTSRGAEFKPFIFNFFVKNGIHVHAIVTDCNHACRVIVNDFASTNPYPSCIAVSIPRNGNLRDYL